MPRGETSSGEASRPSQGHKSNPLSFERSDFFHQTEKSQDKGRVFNALA
jgi:hypothetical protein